MISRMAIPLLLIVHIANALAYHWFDDASKIANENMFALWYFCSEAFIIALFIFACKKEDKTWLEDQFINVEIWFQVVRGTIYGIHYSGIHETNNGGKLMWFSLYVVVVSVIILISALRHGFFKKYINGKKHTN